MVLKQGDLCPVCDQMIEHIDTLQPHFAEVGCCRSMRCVGVMRRRPTMTEQAFHYYLDRQRKLIFDEKAHLQELHSRRERFQQAILQEDAVLFEATLRDHPDRSEEISNVVSVPSGRTHVTALPSERRSAYGERLAELIEEAQNYASEASVPKGQHHHAREQAERRDASLVDAERSYAITGSLCGICKGSCCSSAGEHAFLSALTLRRFMDANPSFAPEAVRQAYLSYVPAETIEGGCVNQAPEGCSLPREMRSDICNSYFCAPLSQYLGDVTSSARPQGVLALQRAYLNWEFMDVDADTSIRQAFWVTGAETEPVKILVEQTEPAADPED